MSIEDLRSMPSLRNWHKKSPAFYQNLGDALSAAALFGLGYSAISETKWLAVVFIVIGVVGIFFQKLFKE